MHRETQALSIIPGKSIMTGNSIRYLMRLPVSIDLWVSRREEAEQKTTLSIRMQLNGRRPLTS
jgi:hypothetical protein